MASDPAVPPVVRPASPFAAEAESAIEAIVVVGAKLLIAEPGRVGRIIRGAGGMAFGELAAEAARRRALPPTADFNRRLALAQLSRAIETPAFAIAWDGWRGACAKPPVAPI